MKDSDYVKIKGANSLYLIISKVDRYFEEKSGNKHLVFDSANENNKVLKKYARLWYVIKMKLRQ